MAAWNPSLAIGHPTIDAHHEELFRRHAALVASLADGDRAEIERMFDFLEAYAVEHFAEEERLMRDAAFPGVNVHRAAHDRFVRDYGELRALFVANGASRAVAVKAQVWIAGWLLSHIAGIDQALADHLGGRPRS